MDPINEIAVVMAGFAVVFGIIFLALYLYHAFAWFSIAKKQKYAYPWFSFIPFLNVVQILQLGGYHWAWFLTALLPFSVMPLVFAGSFGIGNFFLLAFSLLFMIPFFVIMTMAIWRLFEKMKYPGYLALSFGLIAIPGIGGLAFVAYYVIIGLVAWADGF